MPADVYRSFGFPGADDLGNMFQFKRDFNDVYCGHRESGRRHELFPAMQIGRIVAGGERRNRSRFRRSEGSAFGVGRECCRFCDRQVTMPDRRTCNSSRPQIGYERA